MEPTNEPEVRYAMLRPAQVVARRQECPVAYVPLGNVEWHGVHNPLGADTLQAEGLAVRAARKGGGLVMPPLWYFYPLHEMTGWIQPSRTAIAGEMALPPENFALPDSDQQVRLANERYQRLLVDILELLETLGFRVGVLLAGHYPLIAHALVAVQQFSAWRAINPTKPRRPGHDMVAWACCEPVLRFQLQGDAGCGDHGAGWETSNVLALHPQTVDLNTLPAKGEPLIGVGGRTAPQDATAQRGREQIEVAADLMIKEVRDRLDHPGWFTHPAYTMSQGHWKKGE